MIDDDWYMFLFAQEKGIFSLAKVSKKGMWIGFQYWPLPHSCKFFGQFFFGVVMLIAHVSAFWFTSLANCR
jgi:hypothetical protein